MPPRTSVPPIRRLPLVVTGDGDLLDDLLRLAAAGGTEVELAADPAAARTRWRPAPLVLLGADQAQACLRARLPQRPRLVLVGRAGQLDPGWQIAELIGAEHVAACPPPSPGWWTGSPSRLPTSRPAPGARVGRGARRAGRRRGERARRWARRDRRPGATAHPAGRRRPARRRPRPRAGLGAAGRAALAVTHRCRRAGRRAGAGPGPTAAGATWWCSPGTAARCWPCPPQAMAATVDAARRGRDFVVIDLPRQLDDAAVIALQAADQAFVVVPAELRATAAAARVVAAAAPHCAALSVVVRGPAPGRLRATEVARALGLPLAGTLRPEPGLCRGLERGEAPAAAGQGSARRALPTDRHRPHRRCP